MTKSASTTEPSPNKKLNYDKVQYNNIPHVTEILLWNEPQVIKTNKSEESRPIMEWKMCINPLIMHIYN